MKRAEALRRIADLHTAWSLQHGDDVAYVAEDANPHDGQTSDLSTWQADRSASPELDDPLNEAIKAILAQIDDEPAVATTGRTDVQVMNVSPADINLSAVQADFEAHLGRLLAAWAPVTADQQREIADQIRDAIDRDDVAALAKLSASTADAEAALLAAMNEMALVAAQRVVDEAAAQHVNISAAELDPDRFRLGATVMTELLAAGMANAAAREAMRRYSPGASGAEVSRAVQEYLGGLSDAFARENLGGALTGAQNAGRLETQLAGPTAAIYASEWMDRNTCRPCREINGKWIGNSDEADIQSKVDAIYPNGGYVHCLGGVRCRGTTVAVWRPETVEQP